MNKLRLAYECCKRDCAGKIIVEWDTSRLMSPEVVVYCPECNSTQIARISGIPYALCTGEEQEEYQEFIKPHRLIG